MAESERLSAETEKESEDFMFIDKESAILQKIEDTTEDLQGQIRYLCREIDVIWDVLNKVLLTLLPVTLMWVATLLGKLLGSPFVEVGFATAFVMAVILGLAYMDNTSPAYMLRWLVDIYRLLIPPNTPTDGHVVRTSDSSSQTAPHTSSSQQTQTIETVPSDM